MSEASAAKKGLEGVVATSTRISHVDGQAGQLIIGGYPLEEIAGKATFEEVAYVLWNAALGQTPSLPTQAEYEVTDCRVGSRMRTIA